MRRPKCKTVRASADCQTHRFTSHGDGNAVTIDVTQVEQGPNAGHLIVELRHVKGKGVHVYYTDADLDEGVTALVKEDA